MTRAAAVSIARPLLLPAAERDGRSPRKAAAIIALAGPATGRRLTGVTEAAANAETGSLPGFGRPAAILRRSSAGNASVCERRRRRPSVTAAGTGTGTVRGRA